MRRRKTFLFTFLVLSLLLAACVRSGGTEGENSYTIYYPAAELRDVPGEDAIVARTVQLPDADTLTQEELAQQLGVVHTQELDNTAKAVAEWFVQEPDSLRVSGLDLVYTVALDADSNMGYTGDLNKFLYWSGCYGVPDDVTVALLLDDSTAMTAQLYAPQADSAAAELLDDAAGHSELGAAFIDYNGTAYVVAVFR